MGCRVPAQLPHGSVSSAAGTDPLHFQTEDLLGGLPMEHAGPRFDLAGVSRRDSVHSI